MPRVLILPAFLAFVWIAALSFTGASPESVAACVSRTGWTQVECENYLNR